MVVYGREDVGGSRRIMSRFKRAGVMVGVAVVAAIAAGGVGALVALKAHYPRAELFGHILLIMSLVIGAGVIYVLAIYQVWQNTERGKLNAITARFSSLTHEVRGMKSRREANFFRYLLLGFMIAGVVMGEVIVFIALTGNIR